MKPLIIILLLGLWLSGATLQIGQRLTPAILSSQHAQEYKLTHNGILVIAWDKETTAIANELFSQIKYNPNIQLLVDISQIPSGILDLFVLPKFRKFSHPILLARDENYNKTLPYKDESLTLLVIRQGVIQNIYFAEDSKTIQGLILDNK